MKLLYTLILFGVFAFSLKAQLSDQLWLGGYAEFPGQSGYGHFALRFQGGVPQAQEMSLAFNFESTVAVAADTGGQLLFYSNGCEIANRNHEVMPNGSGLNPGDISNLVCSWKGYIVPQGAMALPMPGDSNRYCLLHLGATYDPIRKLRLGPLYYSIVDRSLQNGLGDVVSKNNVLQAGDLNTFAVIRHGNGRDWWVLAPEFVNTQWHIFLLSPQGLEAMPTQTPAFGNASCEHYGQMAVSPDGSLIANWGDCQVSVFGFDRCAGLLGAPLELAAPAHWFAGGGVAFSPTGRYLYATTHTVLFRADLNANTPELDTMRFSFDPYGQSAYDVPGNSFHYLVNGPNGKIYGNIPSRARYFHVVQIPDGAGTGSIFFNPQNISLPVTNARSLPYFPNFRLHDLSGSPCDTLGINGPSVAAKELEKEKILDVSLAPNPANETVSIRFGQPFYGQLSLLDAFGRIFQQHTMKESMFSTLECRNLPDGIYFLQMQTEDGRSQNLKFVIAH